MILDRVTFKRTFCLLPLLSAIAVAMLGSGKSAAAQTPAGEAQEAVTAPEFRSKVIDLLRVNREIERRGEDWQGEGGLDREVLARDGFMTGIGISARRVASGRFMLVRDGNNYLALRFTARTRPMAGADGNVHEWKGSRYEWFLQEDGSADFLRANVRKGTGEVFEGSKPNEKWETAITAGPFELEWSLSDWLYYPPHHATAVALAQTMAERVEEIDAHSPDLEWWEMRSTIAWGLPVNGLQLGLDYESVPHIYHPGDAPQFELLLRNVSQRAVKVQRLQPGWLERWKLVDNRGRAVAWQRPADNGQDLPIHLALEPGAIVSLGSHSFAVAPGPANDRDLPLVKATAGPHKLSCTFVIAQRRAAFWRGTLTSGALDFEIVP